jgi:hypothetical protein
MLVSSLPVFRLPWQLYPPCPPPYRAA